MNVIKYNPFKASSILLACLMFAYLSNKIFMSDKKPEEQQKALEDLTFEPTLGKVDELPIEYFKERQVDKHPISSVFRNKNVPPILYACQDKGVAKDFGKKEENERIKLGIVASYGMLNKEKAEHLLELMELSALSKDKAFVLSSDMTKLGSQLEGGFAESLLDNKDVQKLIVKGKEEA